MRTLPPIAIDEKMNLYESTNFEKSQASRRTGANGVPKYAVALCGSVASDRFLLVCELCFICIEAMSRA